MKFNTSEIIVNDFQTAQKVLMKVSGLTSRRGVDKTVNRVR